MKQLRLRQRTMQENWARGRWSNGQKRLLPVYRKGDWHRQPGKVMAAWWLRLWWRIDSLTFSQIPTRCNDTFWGDWND